MANQVWVVLRFQLTDAISQSKRLLGGVAATYLLAVCLVLSIWHYTALGDAQNRLVAFGNTSADRLSELAVKPLLSNDNLALSALTNDMAMFNEIAGISIYSVDGQLLAVAGNFAPHTTLPTYSQEITVQDTIAGYVNIFINPDAFQTSLSDKVLRSWWLCATGLLTVIGVVIGLAFRANLSVSDPSIKEGSSSHASAFILVVLSLIHI